MRTSELASEGLWPPAKRLDASASRLALGILKRAFLDLMPQSQKNHESKEWQRDAFQWFLSDKSQPGSFSWVCAVLKMDKRVIQQWVLASLRAGFRNASGLKRLVTKRLEFP
jgi:hypothetical protein